MKPLSVTDPNMLRDRLVALGEQWADLDAAANLLEEQKKTLLASLTADAEGNSMALRETIALATQTFGNHIEAMVEARRLANRARVNYNSAQVWCDLVRSIESTRRAEMTMR